MEKRINIAVTEPEAYKAMLGLEKFLSQTGLDKQLKELIKIRASQINGCAYCLNMHTRDARKLGETEQRIYMLSAWKEVDGIYSEEERAVLALTEEVTLIPQGVSDETYNKAAQLFGEKALAQIIIAIVTINAWNRIAISTRLQPE